MRPSRRRSAFVWGVIAINLLVGVAWSHADPQTIERIKTRQYCLTLLNYPVGKIDGIVGPNTVVAYRNFARTHFGPHWDTVPADTLNGYLEMLCVVVSTTYQNDPAVLLDRLKQQDF